MMIVVLCSDDTIEKQNKQGKKQWARVKNAIESETQMNRL
jgi:hypothetical protein